MAKEDKNDWMSAFMNPTKKQFMNYLRGQRGQYAPMIGTLLNQIRSSRPEQDFSVRAYESLLKSQPSAEGIRGAYGSGLQNLAKYIQYIDVSRGARGAADVVSGIGGALGVEGAGDVAQAVGTVSGVGAAGGDVFSKALMQGAAGRFAGLETRALSDLAGRQQELMLGAGQARQAAKSQRQELARMLATARGERRASVPDPFTIASTLMGFQKAKQGLSGYGSGGSSSDDTEDEVVITNPLLAKDNPMWRYFGTPNKKGKVKPGASVGVSGGLPAMNYEIK
jgi:hypothetical protein